MFERFSLKSGEPVDWWFGYSSQICRHLLNEEVYSICNRNHVLCTQDRNPHILWIVSGYS